LSPFARTQKSPFENYTTLDLKILVILILIVIFKFPP